MIVTFTEALSKAVSALGELLLLVWIVGAIDVNHRASSMLITISITVDLAVSIAVENNTYCSFFVHLHYSAILEVQKKLASVKSLIYTLYTLTATSQR